MQRGCARSRALNHRAFAGMGIQNTRPDTGLRQGKPAADFVGCVADVFDGRNLWGARTGGGTLDDPALEPPPEVFQTTTDPKKAPNEAQQVEIEFEQGEPVGLDGQKLPPEEL